MVRCNECHASIPVPDSLQARTMKCSYCGAVVSVPDLAEREAAMLERRRLEVYERDLAIAAAHRRDEAAREAARDHREHKERRSSTRWGRVFTLTSMLLAPVIVSITVFDLPARLGFGDAGQDRLKIVAAQLAERGCHVVVPAASLYATGTVSQLVPPAAAGQAGCLRVLAAGGPSHTALTVRLFDLDSKAITKSESSSDPQAETCVSQEGSLRYEVVLGVAAKGRLTHMAVRCPQAPAAEGASAPPAPSAPSAPERRGKKR